MDIKNAIQMALEGKEEGFTYLYETTYRDKYYLALKFMHKEAEAQDVLQEAYVKAFNKLDTLEDPSLFSSWLGRIVANTAKNALAKNKPLLFSDIEANDDETITFEIEDTSDEFRPERAYSKKETKELVQMMMDSLSDEQRLCILMFYLEGQSIKDIANTFGCSENTVKSRLHYGRNALKKKGEELQSKGYQLYSITPLPLLLFLLRQEKSFINIPFSATLFASNATKSAAQHATKTINKGFLQTITGKITAGVVAAVIVTTGVVGINTMNQQAPEVIEIQQQDLSTYLAGNLSKEEMEFLLSYGPQEFKENECTKKDYELYLNILCNESAKKNKYLEKIKDDDQYRSVYDLEEVNRFFKVLNYQFKKEDYESNHSFISIQEDGLHIALTSHSFISEANITSTTIQDDIMTMNYDLHYLKQSSPTDRLEYNKKMIATLTKKEDGFYYLLKIEENKQDEQIDENQSLKDKYQDVLQSILNQEEGYNYTIYFSDPTSIKYRYTLYDMNQDDIMELIVQATDESAYDYTVVFTPNTKNDILQLGTIETGQTGSYISAICQAKDKNGFFYTEFSTGRGVVSVYRMILENEKMIRSEKAEQNYIVQTEEIKKFTKENPTFEWTDMKDLSLLSTLN